MDALSEAGLDPAWVEDVVRRALVEDLGAAGDVTSVATITLGRTGTADLVARGGGVVAGLPVAVAVLDTVVDRAEIEQHRHDGDRIAPGDVLLSVSGSTQRLLTAERTMLNLLCRASGVATATRAWAEELAGTGAMVLDTRKTTPGLRALEKRAVLHGGGVSHRAGLYDAILVKENHALLAGGVGPAARAAAANRGAADWVEVEVENLAELDEVLAAGADRVLLDNMGPDELRAAVERARDGDATLEASGGIGLEGVRAVAETGVDFVSVGALTHSAPALDLSLLLEAA